LDQRSARHAPVSGEKELKWQVDTDMKKLEHDAQSLNGGAQPAMFSADRLWNSAEVATYLRVSESWVRHRVAAGSIPFRRVGGWLVRFVPGELKDWALSQHAGSIRKVSR
jgi:excisionase family DNA binding protein